VGSGDSHAARDEPEHPFVTEIEARVSCAFSQQRRQGEPGKRDVQNLGEEGG
jgi:hypothetical protein